jgi:hypothetical protein
LLGRLPGFTFVVTPDVLSEIVQPDQKQQIDSAVADRILRVEALSGSEVLALFAELRHLMGTGEAASMALAVHKGWSVASDEKRSVQYDPNQREAYAWWAGQFMEGFADKFNDLPREGEAKNTIVILAQTSGPQLPSSGDVIYFELPAAIGKVQSLRAEVHLFLFDNLPQSPFQALGQLAQARASFWCKTIGVEDDRGGTELRASWHIDGGRPVLRRAPNPFRPTPAPGMQQVRIKTFKEVRGEFDYLFEVGKRSFEPVFDREDQLTPPRHFADRSEALRLVPPEHYPWFRVLGLRRKDEPTEDDPYRAALRKLSPAEGAFILMSMRRRSKAE